MTTASCAGVTKLRDKMCFWSTAGMPNPFGQALHDTRRLATFLLPFCYQFATTEAFRATGCYPFATLLLSDCYHSLSALHHQGTLAMYTSPRRKGSPSESRSSLRADNPSLNPTLCAIAAAPGGLASTSRTRKNSAPVHRYRVQIYNAFCGFRSVFAMKNAASQLGA